MARTMECMNPTATIATVSIAVTLAALAGTALALRAVGVAVDSAICAGSDELTLDHDA
jgi:hypothetical protein